MFTFASNYYQTALCFTPGENLNQGKKTSGQLASAAMLVMKFRAGTRKSLLDFWPPLLEQPIKFVLKC